MKNQGICIPSLNKEVTGYTQFLYMTVNYLPLQLNNIIILMQEPNLAQASTFHEFFFFINTKSGNRQGQQIMSYRDLNISSNFTIEGSVKLTFIDLFNHQNLTSQIQNLKEAIKIGQIIVRIVICGGDGTISWVLNELAKSQVNLLKCAFGVIPIGTGNDFCRTIGWPAENFDFSIENFQSQVKKWINAEISKYDIWDVCIETYKNGKIYDIKDCQQYQREQNAIKKVFSNYVGMGLDARVVYTMEKIRTRYAFFNKILYGLVGFFNLFRPMKELKKKLLSFTESSLDGSHVSRSENSTLSWLDQQLKSTKSMQSQRKEGIGYSFKKKYRGFVCLNANSYMAGLRDMWQTSKTCVNGDPSREYSSQTHNDGKVQFIAYKNQLGLALERCCRTGAKIAQGSGPFQIIFRQTEQDQITHMQIDGQSIKIMNLKSIKISKTDSIQGHQINIMVPSLP